MTKITASIYVEEGDWELCKRLGYNMSEEVRSLMDLLIATSLAEDDGTTTERVTSRKRKLEEKLVLLEKKKETTEEELREVVKQESRFKEKLKIIEKNKLYSAYVRDLNKVVLDHSYDMGKVMGDDRTTVILGKLTEFGPEWTEITVLGHINKLRRYLEGY